jgi:tetratricopeptide (TPR) repeat protein
MADMRYTKFGKAHSPLLCLVALTAPIAWAQDDSLDTLANAGHWKRVRQAVQQRSASTWTEADKTYWEARVKHAFGDLEAAESLARKTILLDKSKAAYHRELASILLDELDSRPGMFKVMSLSREVRNELQSGLSLEPRNVDVLWALMGYLWNAPSIGGGDRELARQLSRQIVQIDPRQGYLAEAELTEPIGEGNFKAESALRKAVAAFPRDYTAHCTLAEFYTARAENFGLAEQEAKAALALAPDRQRAYADLAAIYVRQHKWGELDETLGEAARAVPEDLNPIYQAGKALLLSGGDNDRAERFLQKYLTQEAEGGEPQWGAAHWRLGLVFEKKGMKQKAVEELETAVRLQPGLATAQKDLERLP